MSYSVYPPEEQASAVTDNWQLIASSTPTTGTTVTFSGIATDWRKLWILTHDPVSLSTGGNTYIRTNTLSNPTDYAWLGPSGTSSFRYNDETGIYNYTAATGASAIFNVYITNPSSSLPFATFEGAGSAGTGGDSYQRGWIKNLTSPVTQIDIITTTGYNASNTGSFKLYGSL
jgi:hypothetical protein